MLLSSAQARLSAHCAPQAGPKTMGITRRATGENTNLAMRKSCDFCYFHKKRCDGDGFSRCRRCARKGEGHPCIYSHRKRKERRRHSRDSFPEATQTSPEAEVNVGAQPFKRCTLSASPATGLIGLRENSLLIVYFECVDFLPLTNRSEILHTMNIMVCKRNPAPPGYAPQDNESFGFNIVRAPKRSICEMQDGEGCSGEDGLCQDPSICMFWCALAIGGLAKGQNMETVSSYVSRAKAAVEDIAGPATVELARAWTILAYTHGLGGDIEGFHQYIEGADACLRAASRRGPHNDVQVGFTELVQHRESVLRSTADLASGEIEELCKRNLDLPQIDDFATEGELYRFFMLTYKALEQAFFLDLSGHGRPNEGVNVPAALGREKSKAEKNKARFVLNAVVTRLRVCLREFERLENAVDRPHIQKSVGGFLINCMLVFVKASKGDIEGALDRSSLCIDFVQRYPGFSSWMHTSHILASVLATMSREQPRARKLYETLRASYNPARGNFPAMPPLEEWEEDSLQCGNFYCCSMTWVISSEQIPFCSAQRCHHAPAPDAKADKVAEGLHHHEDGYKCTTEMDDPSSPYVIHDAAFDIRAVSPTSSNDSNEHEAWSTDMSWKTEDMAFALEADEAVTGSNTTVATVVPNLPPEPSSLHVVDFKVEKKAPRVELDFDKLLGFNIKLKQKAPPSSLGAFYHNTRAPAPFAAIEAERSLPDEDVLARETRGMMAEEAEALTAEDWLEATCAMLEAGH